MKFQALISPDHATANVLIWFLLFSHRSSVTITIQRQVRLRNFNLYMIVHRALKMSDDFGLDLLTPNKIPSWQGRTYLS